MLAFTRDPLDRAAARRLDPEWLGAAFEDPDARAVLVAHKGPLIDDDGPVLLPPPAARAAGGAGDPVFLGLADGRPRFALDVPGGLAEDALPQGARIVNLRDTALTLSAGDAGLLAHAVALVQWQRANVYCGRCGSPMVSEEGGHMRRCLAHRHELHPRSDPVVIVVVSDGDRIILGRQPSWPPRRFSALAGFVEPGETLEAAVVRELREEARVEVSHVRYACSQPWPFPASLMLAFRARWASGEPQVGDEELEQVRWFDRDEVEAAARGEDGPLVLPPRFAVARALIDGWRAGQPAARRSGRKLAGDAETRW